jgi:acetolactate synthase-1/2/3 large subunit
MTTGEAAVATLIRNGVSTVFCLPGVQSDYLFDALHAAEPIIHAIHTRHEQGAAYMALGAAMATGKPAVYAVVPGPGFLNTTGALSTAYAASAPVLAMVGQIPAAAIGRSLGMANEIPDQLGVMRTLTKFADRIHATHEAPLKVTEAFRQMISGRSRPAALECAVDVLSRGAPVEIPAAAVPTNPLVDLDAVAQAAKLLGDALHPMIIIGGGAQNASVEVTALAEMLQAPVLAHRMGLGVLDRRNPLCVNMVEGQKLWEHTDVVLAVGTRLSTQLTQWGIDHATKIVRIDADAEELDRIAAPEIGIVGDAVSVLGALLDALPSHNRLRESRRDEMLGLHAEAERQFTFLKPQIAYLEAIRAELPEDGVFVDEPTQLGYVGRMTFPVYRPRTFLSPGYQGTLGWGVAAALGVKVARPETPVLALSGDGGFLFNAQELATAVQYRIPFVVVLLNDNAQATAPRIHRDRSGRRQIATDEHKPDFQKLVESYGALAMKAASPEALRGALRTALAAEVPTVIEVSAGPMPDPWRTLQPAGGRRGAVPRG